MLEGPPMSAVDFVNSFRVNLNEHVIKRSIDKSSEVAKKFITKYTTKVVKNKMVQTDDLEDPFLQY